MPAVFFLFFCCCCCFVCLFVCFRCSRWCNITSRQRSCTAATDLLQWPATQSTTVTLRLLRQKREPAHSGFTLSSEVNCNLDPEVSDLCNFFKSSTEMCTQAGGRLWIGSSHGPIITVTTTRAGLQARSWAEGLRWSWAAASWTSFAPLRVVPQQQCNGHI